jgi:hypothetical protein
MMMRSKLTALAVTLTGAAATLALTSGTALAATPGSTTGQPSAIPVSSSVLPASATGQPRPSAVRCRLVPGPRGTHFMRRVCVETGRRPSPRPTGGY